MKLKGVPERDGAKSDSVAPEVPGHCWSCTLRMELSPIPKLPPCPVAWLCCRRRHSQHQRGNYLSAGFPRVPELKSQASILALHGGTPFSPYYPGTTGTAITTTLIKAGRSMVRSTAVMPLMAKQTCLGFKALPWASAQEWILFLTAAWELFRLCSKKEKGGSETGLEQNEVYGWRACDAVSSL